MKGLNLEKRSYIERFIPKTLLKRELNRIKDGFENESYIDKQTFEEISNSLISKGYSIDKLLTYNEVLSLIEDQGVIYDKKLLNTLQKEGYLQRYLVRRPYTNKYSYSNEILEAISTSILNGGIITLVEPNTKTTKVVLDYLDINYKTLNNYIKLLDLNITKHNNILLFSDRDIEALSRMKSIVFDNTTNTKDELEINGNKYLNSLGVKEYLKEENIPLGRIQYLFNTGVLAYNLMNYENSFVAVVKKDWIEVLVTYLKQNSNLSLSDAAFLLSCQENSQSVSGAIEAFRSKITASELYSMIGKHNRAFEKQSSVRAKRKLIQTYLKAVDFHIDPLERNFYVMPETARILERKAVLGTLYLNNNEYVSSQVISRVLDIKSKYLIKREREKGNTILELDGLPTKYLPIKGLEPEEQIILDKYLKDQLGGEQNV